jgi:endo-1,4-beta-D-glucanase Y
MRVLILPLIVSLLCLAGCGGDKPAAPAATTAKFPFPSNKGPGPYCQAVPGSSNEDARRAYEVWKEKLVSREGANGFRRVIRPDTPDGVPNSTVSEGISYGMILAVYFDDQPLFDDLFRYSLHWSNANGLMHWYINPEGTAACPGRSDCGAASDADEDIAFALIMADKQWGGGGALDKSYRDYALRHIALVKQYEVTSDYVFTPGDEWKGDIVNLSYFAPAFYRIFGRYSNDEEFWNKVVDVNYELLFRTLNEKNGNVDNGLVPAWSTLEGDPVEAFPGALTYHQTDSVRTPIRMAQDYCWNGDPRAKDYLERISGFFVNIGAQRISDGYLLDGTPNPEFGPREQTSSAVFVASAGIAAMAAGADPKYVQETYDLLKPLNLNIRSIYYQLSWTALALTFMTGNYIDLTSVE